MKAYWITPEDIGASGEWSNRWKDFVKKFGYDPENAPVAILLTAIDTDK